MWSRRLARNAHGETKKLPSAILSLARSSTCWARSWNFSAMASAVPSVVSSSLHASVPKPLVGSSA